MKKGYGDDESTGLSVLSYTIDNDDYSTGSIPILEQIGNEVVHHLSIPLEGKTNYQVKRTLRRKQNLTIDCYIGFRARTSVNNLRVQVFNNIYEDICLTFISRGTLKDFTLAKIRNDYLEYKYNGLLLHKQGYILTLHEHKQEKIGELQT